MSARANAISRVQFEQKRRIARGTPIRETRFAKIRLLAV